MKPKFEIGMRVKVIRSGSGCAPEEEGKIVRIIEIGEYNYEVGYKVSPAIGNTETGAYNGFIGEDSFESAGEDFQKKLE